MSEPIEVQQAIASIDQATTRRQLLVATTALADTQSILAADKLIEVLSYNNPATAVVATRGLIKLGTAVVPQVIASLDDHNYSARAWALSVLADLKDPRSLEALIDAAQNDLAPSVRRTALRGLATMRFSASDQAAMLQRCCTSLVHACSDPEWLVRYAAIFGLEHVVSRGGLAADSIQTCRMCLHRSQLADVETVMVVRLRAALALQRLTDK